MHQSDHDLMSSFEACSLDPAAFSHRNHVRLAWIYLGMFPLPQALDRFTRGLQRFARNLGKDMLFHQTITSAYLLIISDRMSRKPELDWEAFAAANKDLFARNPSILDLYYRPDTLASDHARRAFVFPDLIAAPASIS